MGVVRSSHSDQMRKPKWKKGKPLLYNIQEEILWKEAQSLLREDAEGDASLIGRSMSHTEHKNKVQSYIEASWRERKSMALARVDAHWKKG